MERVQRSQAAARAAAISASYPLLRTLVVGSDADFCSLVGSYLCSNPRFDVVALARSGWDALQLASEVSPALVVADFAIDDMTGAAVAKALKARAKPPIVLVVSSERSKDWIDISLRAGADDYLFSSDLERLPEILRRIESTASQERPHKDGPLTGFPVLMPPFRFRATARAPGNAGSRAARTGLNRS